MTLPRRPRVVLAVTAPMSLKLMAGFPDFLVKAGWDVHVVAGSDSGVTLPRGVAFHALPMEREPSLLRDGLALARWVRLLLVLRPALVVGGTPKAGLLAMVASCVTRVPGRVYLLRGLRLETERGPRRRMLWIMEWLTARASTRVQSVSGSLRDEFIANRLCHPAKIVVLGDGSSNGVEIPIPPDVRPLSREELGLAPRLPVIGFVGRVTTDKGIATLLAAVQQLRLEGRHLQVLMVGPEEPAGYLHRALGEVGLQISDVHWIGSVPDARPYFSAMDILCLPTRREGFPNVVLEAAAQGIPAIVSDATGSVDAVVDGETGWVFRVDDSGDLAAGLLHVLWQDEMRHLAGSAAYKRASAAFNRTIVWSRTAAFFCKEAGICNETRAGI